MATDGSLASSGLHFHFQKSARCDQCRDLDRGAYLTWLDTPFTFTPEIEQLQTHVVNDHGLPFWVMSELYSEAQLTAGATLYAPYQIVVTGFAGAGTLVDWGAGMCRKWTWASQPAWLGVWTYFDRDVPPIERYSALIGGDLSNVMSLCRPVPWK